MIHNVDPFATPEPARSDVRRLRGRLAQPVTLWTAPGPAGLTVSSCLIADGEPGRILGLVDEESDLWAAVSREGVFAVTVLGTADRRLADRFAGLMPAPGGLFRQDDAWADTPFGPVPADRAWAGCRLDQARPCGWSLLAEATVMQIHLGQPGEALLHYRGTYRRLDDR